MFKAIDISETLPCGTIYTRIAYNHYADTYDTWLRIEGDEIEAHIIYSDKSGDEAAKRAIMEALLRSCPVKLCVFQMCLVRQLKETFEDLSLPDA